jgi:hypothetical protein
VLINVSLLIYLFNKVLLCLSKCKERIVKEFSATTTRLECGVRYVFDLATAKRSNTGKHQTALSTALRGLERSFK